MTDEDLAAIYRLLAEHHRKLAKEAVLDVVQQYHAAPCATPCRMRGLC